MFSEKAKKHADACRFCWMCRHLCPVQLVTGKETNTPRAKGLLVSMIERGMPMEEDTAKTMYECLLCGACTNDCSTGYDPLIYIREGRTQALVNGVAPDYVKEAINRIAESGNLYGAKECRVHLADMPEKAETLVWLGETAGIQRRKPPKRCSTFWKRLGLRLLFCMTSPPRAAQWAT